MDNKLYDLLKIYGNIRFFVYLSIAKKKLCMKFNRSTTSILCHLVSVVHVVACLLEKILVKQLWISSVSLDGHSQKTMYNYVGIATDGRCKVSVNRCSQTIMLKFRLWEQARTKVKRLHHTSRCKHLEIVKV